MLTGRPVGSTQVIRADLMAETPRSAVNEDYDLIGPERDPARSPLFQVLFACNRDPGHLLELPGLTLQTAEVDTGTAKFDLSLYVTELPAGLNGIGIGRFQRTPCFDHLEVIRPAVTVLDRPLRAAAQNIVNVPHVYFDAAGGADARGHSGEQAIDDQL